MSLDIRPVSNGNNYWKAATPAKVSKKESTSNRAPASSDKVSLSAEAGKKETSQDVASSLSAALGRTSNSGAVVVKSRGSRPTVLETGGLGEVLWGGLVAIVNSWIGGQPRLDPDSCTYAPLAT